MERPFDSLVRHRIAAYLSLPLEAVEPVQRLRRDLGLLPLDLVLIALSLEDVASARLPIEHLDSVETVGQLASFLRRCARIEGARSGRPDA